MTTKNYEQLKRAIQEAVPEIEKSPLVDNRGRKYNRPIRLADVLVAVKEKEKRIEEKIEGKYPSQQNLKYPLFYTVMQSITAYECGGKNFWNFKDNNLDHQSDECKEFLFNLLMK